MKYDLRFTRFFFGILIFFLVFGWLVLLFSATGLFYTGTVVLSILISLALALLLSYKIPLSPPFSKGEISVQPSPFRKGGSGGGFFLVILVSLAISFSTCYFTTPTIFGGRDQGAIATAAIELSKNHSLKIDMPVAHDLFQKYGPGRALNFPGFDYQKDGTLISRFPVGYTSYLASFYNLAGLKGIQFANAIPLFFSLVLFWLTLREFFDEKISFLGFVLAATFFPFLWFAKYSLTEIYMLFLVWAGIYFILSLRAQRSNPVHLENAGSPRSLRSLAMTNYISIAFFALASFVRIEGIIFFLLAVLYIFLLNRKNIFTLPKNFKKYLFISTLFLLYFYFFLNFPALSDSAKNFVKAFLPDSTKDSIPSANLYSYLGRIFFSYNIIPYLIFGLAGIAWLMKNIKKNWAKPEFLIIFISFPAFFYLITPQITLDDPWLFRRFVFAVFPALIFYSIYILNKFFYHKVFLYIVLLALVAANAAVSSRYFGLSENRELLPQIEAYAQKYGANDLILVDRLATGSGYSLMSEPLRTVFNKNAVYFFNAEDLKYINWDRYENIYLLASIEEENPWYAELVRNKSPQSIDVIRNNFLEPNEKKFGLAQNVEAETLVGIWKVQ